MGVVATGVSEARGNFSAFLDDAGKKPGFIKRRRETFVVVSTAAIERAITKKINVSFAFDDTKDGRVFYTKNDVFPDVIGWGETTEKAQSSFIEGLADFCQIFYDNFSRYSEAPNRKGQVIYVLKVVSAMASGKDLLHLIDIDMGGF